MEEPPEKAAAGRIARPTTSGIGISCRVNVLTRALCLLAVFASLLAAQTQERTRNPHGPLPMSCEGCHTATAWTPIRPHPEFNHNTQTAYALRGMHAGVPCQGCHISPVFKKTAHECASCHADLHRAQMGNNCEQCHTVRGWTPGGTRDGARTFQPLSPPGSARQSAMRELPPGRG